MQLNENLQTIDLGHTSNKDKRGEEQVESESVVKARLRIIAFVERQNSTDMTDGTSDLCALDLSFINLDSSSLGVLAEVLAPLIHLRSLDLSSNQLTSDRHLVEALTPLTQLTTLYLGYNHLTPDPHLVQALAPLTQLKVLDLRHNQLASDPCLIQVLAPLTQLTKLYLGDNQLTPSSHLIQALTPLTQLEGLDLSNNQLTSDPCLVQALAPLTQLRGLDLGDNQLTSDFYLVQALTPLTQLTTLYLGGNQLTPSSHLIQALAPLVQLKTLDLRYARLASDPCLIEALAPLTQLKSLDLSDNGLTASSHLTKAFAPFTQLTSLNLSYNKLALGPFLPKALSPLTQLTSLDLSYNRLSSGSHLPEVFATLTQLTSLDLSYNQLTSACHFAQALAPLIQLTSLHLRGNQLTSDLYLVQALAPLTNLTSLHLRGNQLDSDPYLAQALAPLTRLTSLTLSYNKLTSDSHLSQALSQLIQLTSLDLEDNQLTSDLHLVHTLAPLIQLTSLSLSNNPLTADPHLARALAPLTQLTSLGLSSNYLTSNIHLVQALALLTRLTSLKLDDNQLTSSPHLVQALSPLTQLEALYLSYNQITSNLHLYQALAPLTKLTLLHLNHNQLTSDLYLVETLSPLDGLTSLQLVGNQLDIAEETLRSENGQSILRVLRDIVAGQARPSPEFKLVVLGQGRVGKSQLRHRLMGEQVREEKPTHSFEWEVLPETLRPAWPGDEPEKVADNGVRLGTPSAALHIFDFGGQDALWASHRFFISAQRGVFVICASRYQSLAESRVEFWLKYVRYTWEQECELELVRLKEADTRNDDLHRRSDDDRQTEIAEYLPEPSVVVVLTGAPDFATPKAQRLDPAQIAVLCANFGAALVADYDNKEKGNAGLKVVREKIYESLYSRNMRRVWTTLWPKEWMERLTKVREAFGFGASGLINSPPRSKMTLEQYYSEICGMNSSELGGLDLVVRKERELALSDLRHMKSLGVVHWVGEHPAVRGRREEIEKLIFSPAAVRTPVYNVLWSKYPEAKPLDRQQVIDELRGRATGSKPTGKDEDEAELILRLMEVCDLVFEAEVPGIPPKKEYLVPDRLMVGTELTVKTDVPANESEALLRADLKFIPDMLMPRLFGALWKLRYNLSALTRCSGTADYRIGDHIIPVRLCADQATGIFRATLSTDPMSVHAVKTLLESQLTSLLIPGQDPIRLEVIGRVIQESPGSSPSPLGAHSTNTVTAVNGRLSTASEKKDGKKLTALRELSKYLYMLVKADFEENGSQVKSWPSAFAQGCELVVQHKNLVRKRDIAEQFPRRRDHAIGKVEPYEVWLNRCGDSFRSACEEVGCTDRFWRKKRDASKLARPDGGAAGSRAPVDDGG